MALRRFKHGHYVLEIQRSTPASTWSWIITPLFRH